MNERNIIVDANPMIAALLGGRSRRVFHSGFFNFITTERKIWEVKRYAPLIAVKSASAEIEIFEAIDLLPVAAYQDAFFEDHKARALELIGKRDPIDADLLALTLKLGYPLWSHDRDFDHIPDLVVVSTEDVLTRIAQLQASPSQ